MCKEATSMPNIICTIKLHVTPVMSMPLYLFWYCAIPAVPRAARCVSVEGLWKLLGTSHSKFKTSSIDDAVMRALSPINVTWVWLQPGAICGLSLLPRFFSRFSGFPPSTKTNMSKFQFDQDRGPMWKPAKADVVSFLNIVIHLFYFIYVCLCLHSPTQTGWVSVKLKTFDFFSTVISGRLPAGNALIFQ